MPMGGTWRIARPWEVTMTAEVLDAHWSVPESDDARVAALHAFGVLDQEPAPDLDAAARLAAYVCGVPTAAINLIDHDRQPPSESRAARCHEARRCAAT
jgi:hypothetical protein